MKDIWSMLRWYCVYKRNEVFDKLQTCWCNIWRGVFNKRLCYPEPRSYIQLTSELHHLLLCVSWHYKWTTKYFPNVQWKWGAFFQFWHLYLWCTTECWQNWKISNVLSNRKGNVCRNNAVFYALKSWGRSKGELEESWKSSLKIWPWTISNKSFYRTNGQTNKRRKISISWGPVGGGARARKRVCMRLLILFRGGLRWCTIWD